MIIQVASGGVRVALASQDKRKCFFGGGLTTENETTSKS